MLMKSSRILSLQTLDSLQTEKMPFGMTPDLIVLNSVMEITPLITISTHVKPDRLDHWTVSI